VNEREIGDCQLQNERERERENIRAKYQRKREREKEGMSSKKKRTNANCFGNQFEIDPIKSGVDAPKIAFRSLS
jgi:hypothetical protein